MTDRDTDVYHGGTSPKEVFNKLSSTHTNTMRGDPDITTEEVVLQEPTAVLEKQDTEKLRGVGSDDSSDNVAGLDQGDFLKGHDEQLDEDHVIVTGADAANYLLSIRDDGDPALTVRSMVLATVVAAFQAAMNQIYSVSVVEHSSCLC